jgi:hypothetical protein
VDNLVEQSYQNSLEDVALPLRNGVGQGEGIPSGISPPSDSHPFPECGERILKLLNKETLEDQIYRSLSGTAKRGSIRFVSVVRAGLRYSRPCVGDDGMSILASQQRELVRIAVPDVEEGAELTPQRYPIGLLAENALVTGHFPCLGIGWFTLLPMFVGEACCQSRRRPTVQDSFIERVAVALVAIVGLVAALKRLDVQHIVACRRARRLDELTIVASGWLTSS